MPTAQGLAAYLQELRSLPFEKPIEPELKSHRQVQDQKIRSVPLCLDSLLSGDKAGQLRMLTFVGTFTGSTVQVLLP